MKYTKLVATQGCICDGLTIDNNNPADYPIEMKLGFLYKVYKKAVEKGLADDSDITSLLYEAVVRFGDSKFVYHCDECGDNVYDYKMKI